MSLMSELVSVVQLIFTQASVSHRYSAATADPTEDRADRRSGVPHQCRIRQAAGTAGRSGK